MTPRLVARPVRRQLPVLARQRPRAREHRRQHNGQPVQTWATNYVPVFNLLPSGTYYWNVVPVDSEGNQRNAVAGLLLHVVLAVDDDACT